MKRLLLPLLVCAWLPACALFQRPPRPIHAPPEEAERFTWPEALPAEGGQRLSGTMLMAIQLAMEDYIPWDLKPHEGATPREVCLHQRESYDVYAVPGIGDVIFVEISPRTGACELGGEPVMGFDVIYAIDMKNRRILSIIH